MFRNLEYHTYPAIFVQTESFKFLSRISRSIIHEKTTRWKCLSRLNSVLLLPHSVRGPRVEHAVLPKSAANSNPGVALV